MEMFIFLYFILIFLFVTLIVSVMRSSKKLLTKKPKNLLRLTSSKNPQVIIKAIIKFAADKKYEIDHFDADEGKIILSKPLGLFSNGFFFPIYITQENENTLIEISIVSKAIQIGPIPKRTLERCYHGIKAYIFCAEND